VIPGFASDTAQSAFWDPVSEKYLAYVRFRSAGRRSAGITTSEDFETWSEPRLILTPTPKDDRRSWQYYSLCVTPYEGMYIGMLWIFPATGASADWNADTPVTWPELVTSRDGIDWYRVAFGEPFLPLGPPGSFDHRQIRTASSLTLMDDRILLFYSGSPHPHVAEHKYDIGLATLRIDGFASMRAGDEEGSVLTRSLRFDAGQLHVNAVTQPGGYVKAELLDAEGKPMQGYQAEQCRAFRGDSIDAPLAWAAERSLPPAPEEGIRIRFLLRRAELCAFRIEPDCPSTGRR
jgi:hypothetical protein